MGADKSAICEAFWAIYGHIPGPPLWVCSWWLNRLLQTTVKLNQWASGVILRDLLVDISAICERLSGWLN